MDRSAVESLVEYLSEQREHYPFQPCSTGFGSSLNQFPLPEEDGHWVAIGARGLKSVRTLEQHLLGQFGLIDGIPFPPSGLLSMLRLGNPTQDEWVIRVSGKSFGTTAPGDDLSADAQSFSPTFGWPESEESDLGAFEAEEDEVSDYAFAESLRECVPNLYQDAITVQPVQILGESIARGEICLLQHFQSLFAVTKTLRHILKSHLSVNFLAVHDLRVNRLALELGWAGKYAVLVGRLGWRRSSE